MKVTGGKEIPSSNGQLGAFVTKIYPRGVIDTFGDIEESRSNLNVSCVR
jgi:hypothetical protein